MGCCTENNNSCIYRSFVRAFVIVIMCLLFQGCQSTSSNFEILNNPDLNTVKPAYSGNPYKNGSFIGPLRSVSNGGESTWNYLSWKLNPFRKRSPQAHTSDTPVKLYDQSAHAQKPHIVWLGHATILLSLNGKFILIDPILETPKLFHGSRLGDLPVSADQLSIDYLLATHAHRDHLDRQTVMQLQGQYIKAYVPLKMGSLLRSWRPNIKVQEAGWYQTYDTESDISITLMPAYHWSRRNLLDTNSILWGSYLISTGDTTVYIAGDTGYGDHFKEIGTLVGEIDYAILPIGSYNPDHIHKNSHMKPEQALQAFKDLNATTMIPVHYGTFDLSDEPIAEPLERLIREVDRLAIPANSLSVLAIGEVHYLRQAE